MARRRSPLLPLVRLGRRTTRRLGASARNALELARFGRLGSDYAAPFEVVDQGPHHRLRRYATATDPRAPSLLLVPPLMVTSEVYDVGPDVSGVGAIGARGVQPWVVDFGAPEREEGGMRRTLDDHVRAVVRSIEHVRAVTGRDVHLGGYSQGGMFAYQAAAFLRGEGVASVVTFGSPVDIHRSVPGFRADLLGAAVRAVEPVLEGILDRIEGLPGALTSTGFRVLSARKEIQQRLEFLRMLHDRGALERREARRRFLLGEGFVAWPGPALRVFVENFIVHNRMVTGGFVLDGRTVSLADLTCPLLAFYGTTDDMARPDAVRAIARGAPNAPLELLAVPAGHFGLVVGSRAMVVTWPTVAQWVRWREGLGPRPLALDERDREAAARASGAAASAHDDDDVEAAEFDLGDAELLFTAMSEGVRAAWKRLGDVAASANDALSAVRYREPRLRRLAELGPSTLTSPALSLSERAAATPDATFFLWRGRAFPYRAADARVTAVARGLYSVGVRAGDRVGIVMGSRPSFLSMATALSRLGAVAVIAPADADRASVARAFGRAGVTRVAADPELAGEVLGAWRAAPQNANDTPASRMVIVLGGGGKARELPDGLIDLEAIDPERVELPSELAWNAGRAGDLSLVLLRPSDDGELRAVPVTNHRYALSALGAAAACTLTPSDTVYCCVPLHHPTGILASVGAAVEGGARLALAERFDAKSFFTDVRRTGSTIAFYAGEMLRPLLALPPSMADRATPLRLFAGSGMRPELARRLEERFGVESMEFYASTSHRLVLADALGNKPGTLGRPLPGSADVTVVRTDLATGAPVRLEGHLVPTVAGEAGRLAVRLDDEPVADPSREPERDAFVKGDRWALTSDVLLRDEDGDHWFVDSLSGFVPTSEGAVSTRAVEDALYTLPEVELAASWSPSPGALLALVVVRPDVSRAALRARVDEALGALPPHQRPTAVGVAASILLTDGHRPLRGALPKALSDEQLVWSR